MADDIDDLLNEFETKFCKTSSDSGTRKNPDTSKTQTRSQPVCSKRSVKKDVSDIDDILNDILDDEELKKSGQSKSAPSAVIKQVSYSTGSGSSVQLHGTKCLPVFIGGSKDEEGLSTSVKQRACDRLRCTDCDFRVSSFDNMQWHSSTDYLFLRNNMPDFDRVRSKLVSKKGYRAYACQCKWRSTREMWDVKNDADLKWVCGKH